MNKWSSFMCLNWAITQQISFIFHIVMRCTYLRENIKYKDFNLIEIYILWIFIITNNSRVLQIVCCYFNFKKLTLHLRTKQNLYKLWYNLFLFYVKILSYVGFRSFYNIDPFHYKISKMFLYFPISYGNLAKIIFL